MPKYILASQSPRRKEILSMILSDYTIQIAKKEELLSSSVSCFQQPVYLAKQKALEIFKTNQEATVIAADTVVIIDNKILGKPKNKQNAISMIRQLQGKTHVVITGVCIKKKEKICTFNCKTQVTFQSMSEQEILQYCESSDIYDKAGAYAIQGEAAKFIKGIKGDYYNVVGLPLSKLYKKLQQF